VKPLFIHNRYQQFGGEDAVVAEERRIFDEHGVAVEFYCRDNAELTDRGFARQALVPLEALHSRRTVKDIRRVIDKCRPDLAYVHNIYPLVSSSVYSALSEAGVPTVQVAHNFRPFCSTGLLYRDGAICEKCLAGSPLPGIAHRCFRGSLGISAMYAGATGLGRRRFRNADGFMCPTQFTATKLRQGGIAAERLFIRPHCIRQDSRRPNYGNGRYALFLGRLSAEKGIGTLVDAFARTPQIELVIAGTGPMEEEARRTVAERRLDNIRFAGFVAGDAKQTLLDDALFVVFPSECYESFGMQALEAYRAGKPVIASEIGSIPYVVRDGETGYLFKPGNAAELARRVLELAGDEGERRRLGQAAHVAAERDYSPERWFESTMRIFHAVARSQESPFVPAEMEESVR
jgi:glycosyltransferase involved in cell wall biosynthesis